MLFSAIRAKGGFNNNPTVTQFEAAYKALLVHAEIKSNTSANCFAQDNTSILKISSLKKSHQPKTKMWYLIYYVQLVVNIF